MVLEQEIPVCPLEKVVYCEIFSCRDYVCFSLHASCELFRWLWMTASRWHRCICVWLCRSLYFVDYCLSYTYAYMR